jgi:DNA (cytosine-5)-methyltransferase 1
MKVAGLFAGIGGLERGLAAAGHESTLLCEIWDPARAVLAEQYPEVRCERDVRHLRSLPDEIELLVGGFPCQDLSQAGLTAGIGGARSGLVCEVFRLLDRRSVPWVVLENVSFMLQLGAGQAMHTLVEAFESRGYRWAYRVVNSLAFLPQRRERVLFVATNTECDPSSVLLTDEASPQLPETDFTARAHGFYWTEGVRGLGWAADAIPTLKNGSTIGIASPPAILLTSGTVVTPDIRDAERLQGFPENWTVAAEKVAKSSLRWSLVGNAVTVPVAHWLGQRLASPGVYDSSRDRTLAFHRRWPRAGRFDGARRHAVEINAFPLWAARSPLERFLHHSGKPLSVRATKGFLSRTQRAKLRFAPGFQDRIRDHLEAMEATQSGSREEFVVAA